MSNQDQYLKLWQQKRDDLHIDMDMQSDWAEMHQLLEVQMPVNSQAVSTPSLFNASLLHIAKVKLLYALAALLAAGILTYFVLHHRAAIKNSKPDRSEIKKGSIPNPSGGSILYNGDAGKASSINTTINKATADINNGVGSEAGKAVNSKADKTNKSATSNTATMSGSTIGITSGAAKSSKSGNNSSSVLPGINSTTSKAAKSGLINKIALSSIIRSNHNSRLAGNGSNLSRSSHRNNGRYSNSTASFNNSISRVNRDHVLGGTSKTRFSGLSTGQPATGLPDYSKRPANTPMLQAWPPQLILNWDANVLTGSNARSNVTNKAFVDPANARALIAVKTKDRSALALPLDWGILAGINSPGSFTPANKNNTNGVPFDAYAGLFATYNLNNKWAINLQTRLPTPHPVSGIYSHTEEGKADTGKTFQTVNSKITDSRKMYTADIALHLLYNVTPTIGVKAGPVLTLPLKQANGVSSVSTSGSPKDSAAYYTKLTEAINSTNIEKKIRYAISGGVSLSYKRLLLDATYYHSFQTQKVSSSLGNYTSNTNSLQITIGFRLNKKP
ncbi:MAG: hypothetical protein JWQ34_1531 [Mucilaginibacter sp.]|uniref:outer membrane beta-barrel protein n=1 Tax=Mucilaginibacter sp. TaxID=1882438 RepID=UPI00262318D6|nr:outer membrane beta-barrel protein [Mucilaginibacter sp.]MDB5003306.1 hypothetical protein [Mucilaginibacter sp.]